MLIMLFLRCGVNGVLLDILFARIVIFRINQDGLDMHTWMPPITTISRIMPQAHKWPMLARQSVVRSEMQSTAHIVKIGNLLWNSQFGQFGQKGAATPIQSQIGLGDRRPQSRLPLCPQ